jgi:hypothetical protein
MLFLLSAYFYKFHLKPRQAKFVSLIKKPFIWLRLQPVVVK